MKRDEFLRHSEIKADVMSAIKKYLALMQAQKKVVWWARINNGKGWMHRENGTRFWLEYGFKGCSDFIGMLPGGRFMALEAKRPRRSKTYAEQLEFLETVGNGGGLAVLAKSVDEVREVLR